MSPRPVPRNTWKDRFKPLRRHVEERFEGDLRWIAVFDGDDFDYDVRDDLANELSSRQFDCLIHRSMAVFNRPHVEEVYFHLGPADYLVAGYESGTAYHVYPEDEQGVVMLEPDVTVELPGFVEEIRSKVK